MLEKKQEIEYEKVVLIGIVYPQQDKELLKEYLNELAFLAETAGGEVLKEFQQKLDRPNPKTFIGSGKIEEIRTFIKENEVGSAIFDDELSPAQQKNIEKLLRCKVVDRTYLILDIFAQRATTSYARTQVELAQYEYLLPRLVGLWTHLERQRGGIGMRGPGETEIETDRRIVRDKISLLKKKLGKIDRQMAVQRSNRGNLVRVALVGYTNVGKSSLLNGMAKSEVFAENKLFATLDTTVRKVVIRNLPFLLTDTVGFIRKLPTQLIESFKSTLDEVREADLLIHVIDISHPNFEEHKLSVEKTLAEIKCEDKPTIIVFNKIDIHQAESYDETDLTLDREGRHFSIEEWKSTWMNKHGNDQVVFISATEKENFEELRRKIYAHVRAINLSRYPYNNFLYPEYDEHQPSENESYNT